MGYVIDLNQKKESDQCMITIEDARNVKSYLQLIWLSVLAVVVSLDLGQ